MKLEDKIIWPFVLFVICFVIIEMIFFNFLSVTTENYQNIVSSNTRYNNYENIIIYYDVIRESSFVNYLNSNEDEYKERYETYVEKSLDLHEKIIDETSNLKQKENYVDQLNILTQIINTERDVMSGRLDKAIIRSDDFLILKSEFDEKRDFPKEYFQLNVKEDMIKNIEKAKMYFFIMIAVVACVFLLVVGEFIVVKRDIINPLKKITQSVEDIGKGKKTKINLRANPEMKHLSEALNQASTRISHLSKHVHKNPESQDKLKHKVNKLTDELNEMKDMIKLSMLTLAQGKDESKSKKKK